MDLTVVKNATCTFCGCVCDDIELNAEGDRIVKAKNACSLGESWFRNHTAEHAYPDALVDGREASLDEAVAAAAGSAVETAHRLLRLAQADRERLAGLGRGAGSAAAVQEALLRTPVSTIPRLAKRTGLTPPTIAKALDVLLGNKVVSETTGRKRNRVYRYDRYLRILDEGTEPL